jgi:hypothetical protein
MLLSHGGDSYALPRFVPCIRHGTKGERGRYPPALSRCRREPDHPAPAPYRGVEEPPPTATHATSGGQAPPGPPNVPSRSLSLILLWYTKGGMGTSSAVHPPPGGWQPTSSQMVRASKLATTPVPVLGPGAPWGIGPAKFSWAGRHLLMGKSQPSTGVVEQIPGLSPGPVFGFPSPL